MRFVYSEKFWVIILSTCIGILIIAPSFYFRYFDGGYKGIDYFSSDNENFYVSQIREIYDGHWAFGNVLLAEGKNDPYVIPPLPAMIVAFIGKALQVSAININLITKFLLPFLLTIVTYLLFTNLFGRKDLALLMAAFVLLVQATWALLNPVSWPAIFLAGKFPGTNSNFLSYARPIHPQASSFFFFGYLLCIWRFLFGSLEEKLEKRYGIASAAILGFSFYTYFFTYSFLGVFNGVLALWFLHKKEWRQFKKVILVTGGALLVAIPYFINLVRSMQSPFYTQLAHRLALVDSRQFIFSKLWLGITSIFIALYRKLDDRKIFILAFLATAFIVTNQQLLTGQTAPTPAHYHWYYIAPFAGAILIYLFFVYFEKWATVFLSRTAMAVFMMLFLYAGFLYQKNSYSVNRDSILYFQRYSPVLSWLEHNLPGEQSIYASKDLSTFIPAYTSHNVLHGGNWDAFLISEERIKNNLFISYFLDGVTKDKAEDYFHANREWVVAGVYGQYYRMKNGCYGCFDDQILTPLISEYQNFLDNDFVSQLKKYRVDYVVWDKEINSSWNLDRFFRDKVYEKDNIIIYKA